MMIEAVVSIVAVGYQGIEALTRKTPHLSHSSTS